MYEYERFVKNVRFSCILTIVICMAVCNVRIPSANAATKGVEIIDGTLVEIKPVDDTVATEKEIEKTSPETIKENVTEKVVVEEGGKEDNSLDGDTVNLDSLNKPEDLESIQKDESIPGSESGLIDVVKNDSVQAVKPEAEVLVADPEMKQKPVTEVVDEKKNVTNEAPSSETTITDNRKLLYAGAGAVGVAALIIGLSNSGGGDSSDPETPTVPPVGADLAGTNWAGILLLINGKRENVTATVTQNGSLVEIKTSTTQSYGSKFNGTISSSGYLNMYEQVTGEQWTTHTGPAATASRIEIYDYVNNFTGLDVLVLKR